MANHTHVVVFFKGMQSHHYGYQPVKRFVYGNQQFLKIVHDTKQVRFIHFDEWLHQSNTAFTGITILAPFVHN